MKKVTITDHICIFDNEENIDSLTLSVYDNGKGVKRLVYSSGVNASKYYSRVYMKAPKDMLVDHKDRNPLNNCRNNLRLATRGQNCYNSKPHLNKLGGLPKGINHTKWGYRVRVSADGERYSLGTFKLLAEAVDAHVAFIERWHKDFAYTKNKIN